jgi:hypothetical protein
MNRTYVRLLALVLCLLFVMLSGCQPTPQTPPVVGKNNTPAAQASVAPFEAPPAHWKEDAPITLGKLTVTIDADITVPDVTAYPVIRVRDTTFTQEEADQIVAALSEGKELYSPQQTRAELEQQLIELKAQLAQYKEKERESLTYMTESMITEIEEQIKALPENEVTEPPSTKFEVTEVGAEAVDVRTDLGKPQHAFIVIVNRTARWPYASSLEFGNGAHYWPYNMEKHEVLPENSAPVGIKTTREQAAELAQAMMDQLGVQDMQLAVVRPAYLSNFNNTYQTEDVQCWQLTYERRIQDIPVSIYKDDTVFIAPGTTDTSGSYNTSFRYETITAQVDDTGIVLFLWSGPIELLDTINENAVLLPFSDIQKRIKEQLPKTYTNLKYSVATQVHVTSVELGLARVRIKDAADDFMLIPVWDVYGYSDETSPYISGLAKTNPQNFIQTLLTINAMDGSVIDRMLGY